MKLETIYSRLMEITDELELFEGLEDVIQNDKELVEKISSLRSEEDVLMTELRERGLEK